MRIGNISSSTNFGRIYQVVGKRKDLQQLRVVVAEEKKSTEHPAMIYNLTYHPSLPKSIYNKLDGKQFFVVVTGEESLKQTNKLSGDALSEYLMSSADKLIKIDDNIPKDAMDIIHSIRINT